MQKGPATGLRNKSHPERRASRSKRLFYGAHTPVLASPSFSPPSSRWCWGATQSTLRCPSAEGCLQITEGSPYTTSRLRWPWRVIGYDERKGQPPGPAAADVRFVSEPAGWPRLAGPSRSSREVMAIHNPDSLLRMERRMDYVPSADLLRRHKLEVAAKSVVGSERAKSENQASEPAPVLVLINDRVSARLSKHVVAFLRVKPNALARVGIHLAYRPPEGI